MCGEKQSIKRHYGLGTGQECRKHVQKLNGIRGEIDESKHNSDDCSEDTTAEPTPTVIETSQQRKGSRWSDFIDSEEFIDSPNSSIDTMHLNDVEVVLELPRKRQSKTLGRYDQKHKVAKTCQDNDSLEFNYDNNILDSTCATPLTKNVIEHGTKHSRTPLNAKETSLSGCPNIKLRTLEQEKPQPSNNSKWSSFDSNTTNDNFSNGSPIKEEFPYKENKIKFKPLPINKNSKWAMFADEDEKDEDTTLMVSDKSKIEFINNDDDAGDEILTEKTSQPDPLASLADNKNDRQNIPQMLFSLCDDNDLDAYLKI